MNKMLKIWLNVNPHQERARAKEYSDCILQKLLSQYHPQQQHFEVKKGENGKPYVEGGPHFSYTHSGRLHAYVLDDAPIGIDLEQINEKRNIAAVTERHYHESEWQQFKSMNPSSQMDYFYQLWTQKEAWCKHQGGVLWYFLPKAVADSGLNFYQIDSILGMACCVAATHHIDRIDVNVIK